MGYKEKDEKKNPLEAKSTNTAFILMFPSLIIAGMAALTGTILSSLLAIALVIYQFLMLKKFIEDYYNSK